MGLSRRRFRLAARRLGRPASRESFCSVAHLVPSRRPPDDGCRRLVRLQARALEAARSARTGVHAAEPGHLGISDRSVSGPRVAGGIAGWKGLPGSFIDQVALAVAEAMRASAFEPAL